MSTSVTLTAAGLAIFAATFWADFLSWKSNGKLRILR